MTKIAPCPRCHRDVATVGGLFKVHGLSTRFDGPECPLSLQRRPIIGTQDYDYAERAELVSELAAQLQDEDPTRTWEYLQCLPSDELQRMTMLALAAINCNQTVDEMFAWAEQLAPTRGAA